MTSVITFTGNPVAQQIVDEGDGETLIINQGPATVYFGDDNAIRASDTFGVVPITANSYFAVNGEKSLYACVVQGDTANLQVISGGLNFFLPVTSLTIPYGATGQRIVINPPAFPGSIVGYNPAGLIEFIISPSGYLIYDATGGALNHLFIALQNTAGTDTFGNPFAKGIQVGPQTGPQVLIAGGNPSFIRFPLNDSGFAANYPYMFASVGTGVARYSALAIQGPTTSNVAHDDSVELNLNSPNADGSSSANFQIYYNDVSGNVRNYFIQDYTGIYIQAAQIITATQPGTGLSVTNPAIGEIWHSLGTLAGYTANTGRYRMLPDKHVEIEISVVSGGSNAASVPFQNNLPAPYRPLNDVRRPLAIAGAAITTGTVFPNVFISAGSGQVTVGQNSSTAVTIYGHAVFSLD